MDNLISKHALQKILFNGPVDEIGLRIPETQYWDCCDWINWYEEQIDNAPTVDAVPIVYGHWEKVIPTKSAAKWSTKVACSMCHKIGYTRFRFCPNCGANMEEQK